IFNIAFTSIAQALVQLLAPSRLRGRVVGLFNTSMLGLRAGSGVTVGVLGALTGVEWSLALSATAVVIVAVGLLLAGVRACGIAWCAGGSTAPPTSRARRAPSACPVPQRATVG